VPPHAVHVARACAHGIVDVSLATGIPVTFGVITAHTREQALARSDPGATGGGKRGHKGREAAEAAIRLVNALRGWEQSR
jgi:6,7-dimethyl-8-ribityllumazine synthase